MSERKENTPNQENPETPQQQNSEEENPENQFQEQPEEQEEEEEEGKNKKTVTQEQSSESSNSRPPPAPPGFVECEPMPPLDEKATPTIIVLKQQYKRLVTLMGKQRARYAIMKYIGILEEQEEAELQEEVSRNLTVTVAGCLRIIQHCVLELAVVYEDNGVRMLLSSLGIEFADDGTNEEDDGKDEENLENPPQEQSQDQPEEEEEEKNKKTVMQEQSSDSGSKTEKKKLNESVCGDRVIRNPRNVVVEPLEPYLERLEDEEEKPRENPEKRKKNDPEEEKSSEDVEEAWSEANFDTLNRILESLADYLHELSRFPYNNVKYMEDFVNNWMKLDIPVRDCLVFIKRLKKNYKKKFCESIGQGLFFRNQIQLQLFNSSNVLWVSEAYMNSDDEGEEEEEEEEEQSGDEEVRTRKQGEGNLEWKRPDVQRRLDFPEPEYDPAMRHLLPFSVRSSLEQDPGLFADLMPVDNPVSLAILPPFQGTNEEDNNQQGSGEASSSVNRTGPGKPHEKNHEDGSEAPEEPNSGNEETKDTKKE